VKFDKVPLKPPPNSNLEQTIFGTTLDNSASNRKCSKMNSLNRVLVNSNIILFSPST
jgi:hypothetical protein